MQFRTLTKVTIVAEPVLRDELVAGIIKHGAPGYTCSDASGIGSRGVRRSSIPGENIQIEVVCERDVAAQIMTFVAETYSTHYACTAWASNVEVLESLAQSQAG